MLAGGCMPGGSIPCIIPIIPCIIGIIDSMFLFASPPAGIVVKNKSHYSCDSNNRVTRNGKVVKNANVVPCSVAFLFSLVAVAAAFFSFCTKLPSNLATASDFFLA